MTKSEQARATAIRNINNLHEFIRTAEDMEREPIKTDDYDLRELWDLEESLEWYANQLDDKSIPLWAGEKF